MTITFDLTLTSPELLQRLDRISNQLADLNDQGAKIMATLDDLTREVQENSDAVDSATALLQGLKAQLDAAIASGDMGQVQALSDQLSTQTDKLAAAVAANTPATP